MTDELTLSIAKVRHPNNCEKKCSIKKTIARISRIIHFYENDLTESLS